MFWFCLVSVVVVDDDDVTKVALIEFEQRINSSSVSVGERKKSNDIIKQIKNNKTTKQVIS